MPVEAVGCLGIMLFATGVFLSSNALSTSSQLHTIAVVYDVPAHLIKQTVGLRWAGMWVMEAWEWSEAE